MTVYKTVEDLKRALDTVPDDMPLLSRDRAVGFQIGIDAGKLSVMTVGSESDIAIVAVDDEIFKKWKGAKGVPFDAILFD